ncbi:MAG: hypothetical protein M1837_002972 [Sclerophora amabilis]|nr:MAG: hypothetical protein M1837_002972 [Sclerophora amabilis]
MNEQPSHSSPSNVSSAAAGLSGRDNSSNTAVTPRIRRRNRLITSCLECRRRKLKCDRTHPCKNCTKTARDCVFLAPALDPASQSKLTEIKEKVGSLEQLIERDVAHGKTTHNGGSLVKREDDDEGDWPELEDEKNLEPTPLAVIDVAYEEDADDELFDLGFQFGKMRLTERIGGYFRPRVAEELENVVNDPGNDFRMGEELPASPTEGTLNEMEQLLRPRGDYLEPSPGFFFGATASQASLIDFLPSKAAADSLIAQYFLSVHAIARAVHRPTFERQYGTFWSDIAMGIEPSNSLQAVVFAALLSGIISMDEIIILRDFGVSKETMVENFRLGTETALARAGFLRSTKIETLQAFVMYLCIGLHRDGEHYGLSAIETHVRRILWYQLCFLDIRTCEAQGPQPTIRRKDYDTKIPLNVDDAELQCQPPPVYSAQRWTDSTFSIMRFECIEMHRTMWADRSRLERKKITLTAVLGKIERFRKGMEERYFKFLDTSNPVQRCARLVVELLMSRLHIMVLHRYQNSVSVRIPDRLRQIILTSGTRVLENAVTIESDAALSPWAWYAGAHQQHQTALLLLGEVYAYPMRREADRIWACLDYVFETDSARPREEKGRKILTELRDKSTVYRKLRKARAPMSMIQNIPIIPRRTGEAGTQGDNRLYTKDRSSSHGTSNRGAYASSSNPGDTFTTYREGESGNGPSMQVTPPVSHSASPAEQGLGGTKLQEELVVDIDWSEWDKVFPPDINTGDINFPMDTDS